MSCSAFVCHQSHCGYDAMGFHTLQGHYRISQLQFYRATFQLAAKFGIGRSGGMPNAILISLTSEERRARPHIR